MSHFKINNNRFGEKKYITSTEVGIENTREIIHGPYIWGVCFK